MISPALRQWLQQVCHFPLDQIQEIPGDASFRRYFRLHLKEQSYIIMDASQQLDCCEPYLAIARALLSLDLAVPEILAHDVQQGYMLISDFGDRRYLQELRPENADQLYYSAMSSLSVLQTCRGVKDWALPAFDQAFMQRELDEFRHWFLERYLQLALAPREQKILQTAFDRLLLSASEQPQVFIHRDYHSANLMWMPKKPTGILDFQDACIGPVTYDLVSLLRDCYIDWPQEKVRAWVAYYYEGLRENKLLQDASEEQFFRWFDWMGMQRHMKALFIFARKYLRDQTPRYLEYLPRTLNYVVTVSQNYPELQEFHHFMRGLSLSEAAGAALCAQ